MYNNMYNFFVVECYLPSIASFNLNLRMCVYSAADINLVSLLLLLLGAVDGLLCFRFFTVNQYSDADLCRGASRDSFGPPNRAAAKESSSTNSFNECSSTVLEWDFFAFSW